MRNKRVFFAESVISALNVLGSPFCDKKMREWCVDLSTEFRLDILEEALSSVLIQN